MPSSTMTFSAYPQNQQVWNSLKQAIASSSGFQRWKQEVSQQELNKTTTDSQVRRYLRETLETLAY